MYVTNSSGNTADASFPRFTVGALEKSCSPSDDYTLSIITGEAVEITPSTVAELERVFCTKYPKMVERFHPEAPRAITVFFENQDASMHSGNYNSHLDQVNLNATTMAAFPVAIDSTFTHELMHAVQEPYSPDRPSTTRQSTRTY